MPRKKKNTKVAETVEKTQLPKEVLNPNPGVFVATATMSATVDLNKKATSKDDPTKVHKPFSKSKD